MIFVPHLTSQCESSRSFCTMKLRFLYSTVSALKSIVGMVVTTSPSFNSYCLLLALLFSPAVGPLFPAVVALFTRCGSALLSSIRSTISAKFTESADSSSVLLRAVRHALLDVLVYRTWSAGWTSTTVLSLRAPSVKVCDLRAQLLWFASTSFLALANGLSMTSIVLRVYCFGRTYVPPKLFEFCSHRCVWPCATWSVGTSLHRHARFDRPVSMSGGASHS